MDIKKARQLVDEMLELCSQVSDETLTEASEGIYRDVHAAKSVESIINSARELMVFVAEVQWDDLDSDETKSDIEITYNQLLEDYEEFE